MGWDYRYARHIKNGRIDRKAEVDEELNIEIEGSDTDIKRSVRVIKSQMKGSIYYGAVATGLGDVIGVVVVTKVKDGKIGMKIMEENVGPCYVDCPNSIFKLLTKTDNKYALIWREKCLESINSPNKALKKLKTGSKISFVNPYDNLVSGTPLGATIRLTKVFRYRKTVWSDGYYAWRPDLIPENWTLEYAA